MNEDLIKYNAMIKAYEDVLFNLCQRELIPSGREYVIKRMNSFKKLVKDIEDGK
jgi:hypothetical protein